MSKKLMLIFLQAAQRKRPRNIWQRQWALICSRSNLLSLTAVADLNCMDKKSRSSVEMNDPASRPEIAERFPNMTDYETAYIGFPIWWYVAPRIISTFVESYDFSGKTMVPFATSGGSGMGRTVDELKKLCPDADWKAGKMVNGASERELADWANKF